MEMKKNKRGEILIGKRILNKDNGEEDDIGRRKMDRRVDGREIVEREKMRVG